MQRIRHVTPTEFSLHYSGELSGPDAEWVAAHLEECTDCAEEYELMWTSLRDLRDGKIRKMWPWQFRRFWGRVEAAETGLEEGAALPETVMPSPVRAASSSLELMLDLATVAPGGGDDERTALVCDKEPRRVRADWDLTPHEGFVSMELRITEDTSKLVGRRASAELSDGRRTIKLGPHELKMDHDQFGPFLRAELNEEFNRSHVYTEEQLWEMDVSVKIEPAQKA